MKDAGGGAIVNIGWVQAGERNLLAYGASKGSVFALSSALAYDHLTDRIRINVVVPGPQTASGMVEIMANQGHCRRLRQPPVCQPARDIATR